jgi:K+-sensing histidine kinase KdpD
LLLKSAHRLAGALKAEWTVVSVETSRSRWLSVHHRDSRANVFRLAESLGAETANLQATSPPEALLEYAKLRGARILLVGAPRRRSVRPLFRSSIAEALIRGGSDVEVVVVARPGMLEHRILETLARNGDRIVTSGALIKEVWGPERDDSRALRVYIGSLRRELEADPSRPKYILTELGVGYRLAVDNETA